MAYNPYEADESAIENVRPEYSMPTTRDYMVPSLEAGDAYTDEFGWSPNLRASATDVPSGQRLGTIPRRDYRPEPTEPSKSSRFWRGIDSDDAARHVVEEQKATPFAEPMGLAPGDRRWAPNPRSTPPPEPRVTNRISQHTYSFTRPFDTMNRTYAGGPPTGSARTFNGDHFSMADHRRNYEVVGTAPVRNARNTYRIEPTPWDTNVVDMPVPVDYTPNGRVQSVEVPSSNRSGRLS